MSGISSETEARISKIAEDVAYIRGQWDLRPCSKHQERLEALEMWKWKATGMVILVGSAVSIMAPALVKVFAG